MAQSFFVSLGIAATLAAPLQAAQAPEPDPLTLSFAVCAGRYAALANAPVGNARDMRAAYDQFADLLGAIGPLPDDQSKPARRIRAARARARAQTAQLLDISHYGSDQRRSRLALAMVSERRRACDSLLG